MKKNFNSNDDEKVEWVVQESGKRISFNEGDISKHRIIRKPQLLGMIGLSDPTVWRLERAGKFPRRIKLGSNSIGWIEFEVFQWLETKAADRKAKGE